MRYAPELGFEHGGEVCGSVTRQLMGARSVPAGR
jgi:hypothetical protein